jgi:hypothetical protein
VQRFSEGAAQDSVKLSRKAGKEGRRRSARSVHMARDGKAHPDEELQKLWDAQLPHKLL